MSANKLELEIIQLGEKNKAELLKLMRSTSANKIIEILNAKLGRNDCNRFWNCLLQGFDLSSQDAKEKRFACVLAFLKKLQLVELSYRQTYDLVTRLCQDLPTFSNDQLIEILEHCMDGIRMGDPKCVSWKDLLPYALRCLADQAHVSVNGIAMSGGEYRNTIVKNLCAMKWPAAVLTPLAVMFNDLQLEAADVATVLKKFAAALQSLPPAELPALAYQLFSLCATGAQIFVPIFAFDKYFHRYYYKKLFEDMQSDCTDFDSIDAFSDKELLEAEETVLHHLNYTTQNKITELQMCVALKNFQSLPDAILTPFVISALLAMSSSNGDPAADGAVACPSLLLTFLRCVFRSNEQERALAESSVWCRDSLQRRQVDLEQVFAVLIDQNKQGKDVITPGLINLAFALLKAKGSPTLNEVAINFLVKFIRKRFIFGAGIIKCVAEWMVVEQDQLQYAECLMLLSVADTFTVSECVKSIQYVMDFFKTIPGEQAMRMMGFILPVLKLSSIIRDSFIEVLRNALQLSDAKTRQMAIYGFCMILKQLNNSNSQRSQLGFAGMCTQQSISGFSAMTQAIVGQHSNPQRHFDMLTLEIIGLLRTAFSESLDIKCMLYENLQRAVELNPKLVAHVLQFIECHFREYFQVLPDGVFAVHFHKLVRHSDDSEHQIEVADNLGRLILCIASCLTIFEQFHGDYDVSGLKQLLDTAIEKVVAKQVPFEEATGSLTYFKCEMYAQQLHFIEGLMAYALLTATTANDHVQHLLPLYAEHTRLRDSLCSLASASKKAGHKKATPKGASDSTDLAAHHVTVNGVPLRKLETNVPSIWDLKVIERCVKLLHDEAVSFAAERRTPALRSNCDLVCHVFAVATQQIGALRLQPAHKQLRHSKRTLQQLTDIAQLLYERCVKRLPALWRDFDMRAAALAAECFLQCLRTANALYKPKFNEVFLRGVDLHMAHKCKACPAVIHDVIDEFMTEDAQVLLSRSPVPSLSRDADGSRIPVVLLQCLEILYDNIGYDNRMAVESYTWLLHFCQQYVLTNKELGVVHKLLFVQRQKTHSGAFLHVIARHLGGVLGFITDVDGAADVESPSIQLKSITLDTAESCLQHLYASLGKQIEMLEYFIVKANNLSYKYRMLGAEDRELCVASLRSLERSVCSQLVHISNCLLELTNVCIPLGPCMDALMRLVGQHFGCLRNMAKHLLACSAVMKVPIQQTRFDTLLGIVGKRLPHNVYTMITYIEDNLLDEDDSKKCAASSQLKRAKLLREIKKLPKTIACIEQFNWQVLLLAKKTTDRLVALLHRGVVRDFRLKTSELRDAIDRALSRSSQIESAPSDADVDEHAPNEADVVTEFEADASDEEAEVLQRLENESKCLTAGKDSRVHKRTARRRHPPEDHKKPAAKRATRSAAKATDEGGDEPTSTPENENVLKELSGTDVLQNLEAINKKAKKRMLRESEGNADPDVATTAEPSSKKRRRPRAVQR